MKLSRPRGRPKTQVVEEPEEYRLRRYYDKLDVELISLLNSPIENHQTARAKADKIHAEMRDTLRRLKDLGYPIKNMLRGQYFEDKERRDYEQQHK